MTCSKSMLKVKFIVLNAYFRKEERSKVNHLNFYLRKLEKVEQIKSEVSRRKEIIKLRAEIHEIRNRKSIK